MIRFLILVLLLSCSEQEDPQVKLREKPDFSKPTTPNLNTDVDFEVEYPTAQFAYIDESFSYQINVSNNSSTLSYSCIDCTSGLSVDSSTGLVSYSPSEEGVFSSSLSVTDGDSSIEFILNIEVIRRFLSYCNGDSQFDSVNNFIEWMKDHYNTTDCSSLNTSLSTETSLAVDGVAYMNIAPISEFSNIEFLTMRSHKLRSIVPIKNFVNLKSLDVSGNELRDLNGIEDLVSLINLNVSNNLIERINNLNSLSQLQTLIASRNIITRVQGLVSLADLEYVDLSFNMLTKFTNSSIPFYIKELILRGNRLSSFKGYSELEHVQTLDVSFNQIQTIENLIELRSIKTLDIGANPIADLSELRLLKDLVKLSVAGLYAINEIDIKGLNKLKFLDIRLTRLTCPDDPNLICISYKEEPN